MTKTKARHTTLNKSVTVMANWLNKSTKNIKYKKRKKTIRKDGWRSLHIPCRIDCHMLFHYFIYPRYQSVDHGNPRASAILIEKN